MWPTEEATEHVEELARRHGVEIIWWDRPPTSHPGYQMVWINRPSTSIAYLTSLHELGHCVDDEARRLHHVLSRKDQRKNYGLWHRMESHAWSWAFAAVRPELAARVRARDWQIASSAWLSYGKHLASRPAV